jgi:hypothetical protein
MSRFRATGRKPALDMSMDGEMVSPFGIVEPGRAAVAEGAILIADRVRQASQPRHHG